MAQRISIPPDSAFFTSRVELDGTNFLLEFAWNGRLRAWTVGVLTQEGDPLVEGVTVVTNRPLLKRFKSDPRMPAGDLLAFDATSTIEYADYTQLGNEVDFLYVTEAELEG